MGASLTTGLWPSSSPWRRLGWPLALASLLALSPPAPANAQSIGGGRTITVRSGDTLDGISQRTGVSVADLKRINGLKSADLLQVGQVLRLSSPAPALRKGGTVTIQSGDTLETIAKAHKTSVEALLKANPGIQPEKLKVGSTLKLPATAAATPAKPTSTAPAKPASATPATPAAPTATPPPAARVPDAPPLTPPASDRPESSARGRWRYYGDTVVDWGSWKRLQDGVRFTLVQAAATDVGEGRAQATAIAVDCSTLRHTWRVKEAWEAWTVPAPRSVGQQIVLDLCGNTAVEDRRPVPPPPSPTP
ncbi:MAG: LysM peptidoglycan-binding domain-containing protein [Cyanobacteriota bacterium]|nr:LysM peptidoglycan-binding domain-containing protein [Cyanobacteriota bacterium]